MRKIPSTLEVQEANELVVVLQKNLPKVIAQPFQSKKIPMSEKIEYLKNIATAKRALWQAVEKQIPEIKGKNYTVSSVCITYEEDLSKENNQKKK